MKNFTKSMIAAVAVAFLLTAGPASAEPNETVRSAQSALKDKGIDPGPIDGINGPLTHAAVKQFQEQNSLTASGKLDKATLKALGVSGGGAAMGAETQKTEKTEKTEETAQTGEAPAGGKNPTVPFPNNYRRWHHVKSMIIYGKEHPLFEPFGGIHHVYVNDKGVAALKAKKSEFPTGTMFAFDLLDIDQSGGAITEGKRKFVANMVRDPVKYKDTEGWGWQVFEGGDPSKPAVKEVAAARACATCHKEVQTKQFVFSEWRQ